MKSFLKISIGIALILIGGAVFYYFVIFIPQREDRIEEQREQEFLLDQQREQRIKSEKESKEQEDSFNETILEICLDGVETDYDDFWNSECQVLGRGDDCLLPEYNADRVDRDREESRDACFKQYSD